MSSVNVMVVIQIPTSSHRGKDRATDSSKVGGVRGRRSHLIEGVSVVDVICAKLLYHLGEIEGADLEEKRILGV